MDKGHKKRGGVYTFSLHRAGLVVSVLVLVLSSLLIQPLVAEPPGSGSDKKGDESKKDDKPDLHERIKLVLKYGHSEQVRDVLKKIAALPEKDQRQYIPELKKLTNTDEPLMQVAIIRFVNEVKWNDLDKEIIKFFDSPSNDVLYALMSTVREKKIDEVTELIVKYLKEKTDYKVLDNRSQEMINTISIDRTGQMNSFFFEKLQDLSVDKTYKVYMIKYISLQRSQPEGFHEFITGLITDDKADVHLRTISVRTVGKLQYKDMKEVLHQKLKQLEGISDPDLIQKNYKLRLEIISTLIKLGDDKVREILIDMTRSDDENVRIRAMVRLTEMKDREIRDILEYKKSYDTSLKVQRWAKKLLEDLDKKGKENIDDEDLEAP